MQVEKRDELEAEKQKQLLTRLVQDLSQSHPDLYYQPTSQIALLLKKHIDSKTGLNVDEKSLMSGLSRRDIEVILSHH